MLHDNHPSGTSANLLLSSLHFSTDVDKRSLPFPSIRSWPDPSPTLTLLGHTPPVLPVSAARLSAGANTNLNQGGPVEQAPVMDVPRGSEGTYLSDLLATPLLYLLFQYPLSERSCHFLGAFYGKHVHPFQSSNHRQVSLGMSPSSHQAVVSAKH